MKCKVFISYSHLDKKILESFKRHKKSINKEIEIWDDSKIKIGEKWREKIDSALESCNVTILFMSADFINSKFIMEEELPYLLKAAKNNKVKIIVVNANPVSLAQFPELLAYQHLNSPNRTISEMKKAEIERLWMKLTDEINSLIN